MLQSYPSLPGQQMTSTLAQARKQNESKRIISTSDMENVGAIAVRVMPCLLVRLRRTMALTAVFQSNQNDRVTLERHRESIFLASHSRRDILFPLRFLFYFYFYISAPTLTAWPL